MRVPPEESVAIASAIKIPHWKSWTVPRSRTMTPPVIPSEKNDRN
jgi:hypothetical protein